MAIPENRIKPVICCLVERKEYNAKAQRQKANIRRTGSRLDRPEMAVFNAP
jgi:hypothetical protein